MKQNGILTINMDIFGGTFLHGPITLKVYKTNFVGKQVPHNAFLEINGVWIKNLTPDDVFPELEIADLEGVL